MLFGMRTITQQRSQRLVLIILPHLSFKIGLVHSRFLKKGRHQTLVGKSTREICLGFLRDLFMVTLGTFKK